MRYIGALVLVLTAAVLAGCPGREASSSAALPKAPVRGASPPASDAGRGPPIPERFTAWLALYDEAGFPDVARLDRVDRFTGIVDTPSGPESARGSRESVWVLRRAPGLRILKDSLWTEDVAPETPDPPRRERRAHAHRRVQPRFPGRSPHRGRRRARDHQAHYRAAL